MTTIVTTDFSGPYFAAGEQTFGVDFQSISEEEIEVYLDGALVDPSQYTFNRNKDGTGSISFFAPKTGEIYIYSAPAFRQPVEFERHGAFYPDQIDPALDRLARYIVYLKERIKKYVLKPTGDIAGKYLAFDASGNPIAASGTGADLSFRTDLAATTGASLVGMLDGTTLSQTILTTPRRLSYAKRAGNMTLRQARLIAADIHNQIVGYAQYAGITGGSGKTIYLVTIDGMDATLGGAYPDTSIGGAGTYAWCKAQASVSGGMIIFYPTGHFNPIIRDATQNRFNIGQNDITIIAPGRNVTMWHTSLSGSTVIKNQNMITAYIEFRTMPGPMSGDMDGSGEKAEKILVNVDPSNINKQAWLGCTFDRASDGALDIAATAFTGASPIAYFTVQNCVFRNTDECSLIGSISDTSTITDVRKLFGTFYNCVWDGCGQRLPKVLGNAFVDMVDCYSQILPWRRDQPAPIAEYGSCYGAGVQNGGWLNVRGSLWTVLDDVTGREATRLVANPTSGETGAIKVTDSAAEYGMTFATNRTDLIPAIPYTLAHTPVPAVGAARETWIADCWKAAGAGNDPAPEGLFLWDPASTDYPDQTYIVRRRGADGTFLAGREIRVDARADVVMDPGDTEAVTIEGQGYTHTIGFLEGKASSTAIGPNSLDLAGNDSSFFAVRGNGGPATLKFVEYTDGGAPVSGQEITVVGSSSEPVTVKNVASIAVSAVDTSANSLTITGHGMATGDFPISFTNSGGALPAGLVANTQYYAAVVDANTLKVALTYADAMSGIAGSVVDLTDVGTGTHTAAIGNFNLPGGRDVKLDSTAKIVKFRVSGSAKRFSPQGGTFETDSGTYTPTLTAVANCSGLAFTKAQYSRNGSIVNGSLLVTGTQTAASTLTKVGFSLPFASALAITGDLIGTCSTVGTGPIGGATYGDATNDRGEAEWICTASAGAVFVLCIIFQYEIK